MSQKDLMEKACYICKNGERMSTPAKRKLVRSSAFRSVRDEIEKKIIPILQTFSDLPFLTEKTETQAADTSAGSVQVSRIYMDYSKESVKFVAKNF